MRRIYLNELEHPSVELGIIELVIEPEQTATDKAKKLLSQARQASQLPPEVIIELIEITMLYKFPHLSRQEIVRMLNLATESKQTRVYQEGVEEGIQRGERALILRLLNRRFGQLNSEMLQQIEALSLDKLELLGEALLDFSSLKDLTNWLRENRP